MSEIYVNKSTKTFFSTRLIIIKVNHPNSFSFAKYKFLFNYFSFVLGECRVALGMEAGRIPDHQITASSSYEAKSVGPQNAR